MSDLEQIDALIGEFFRAFDNRAGARPTAAAMVALFAGRAVICRHAGAACEFYSPLEFAQPRAQLLGGGTLREFHEWEVDATTTLRGPIAMRVSRYAKDGLLDGAAYGGSGSKVFQLSRLEGRWRILCLSWIDDPP